jgi:hypothetical protein
MKLGIRSPGGQTKGGYVAPLLKTGQTVQYSSKKDDGYYEKGLDRSYKVLSTGQYSGTTNITLNSKTHALSNNCVQDEQTGLMWARYVPTADIGPDNNGLLFWIDDVNNEDIFAFADQANAQSLGGHTDWRVPNVLEFMSLIVWSGSAPFIDGTAFPSTPPGNYTWTSTTHPLTTTKAVYATMGDPGIWAGIPKATTKAYCRLVRGD